MKLAEIRIAFMGSWDMSPKEAEDLQRQLASLNMVDLARALCAERLAHAAKTNPGFRRVQITTQNL